MNLPSIVALKLTSSKTPNELTALTVQICWSTSSWQAQQLSLTLKPETTLIGSTLRLYLHLPAETIRRTQIKTNASGTSTAVIATLTLAQHFSLSFGQLIT